MPVIPRYPRLLARTVLAGALGLGAAASAQESAPVANGYVCLSNGCARQAQQAATQTTAPRPGTAAFNEQVKTRLAESLLSGLTEEQRATGQLQVNQTVQNGMVTVTASFEGANGYRASRVLNYSADSSAPPPIPLPPPPPPPPFR